MWWAWLAGGAAALVMLMALSRIRIRLSFTHQGENDQIMLDVRALFGLVRFRYAIPMLKFRGVSEGLDVKTEEVNTRAGELMSDTKKQINLEKIKQIIERVKTLLQHCFQFNEWLRRLLAHVHCVQFTWHTSLGVGGAAETAFLVGTAWSLKSSLLGYLFRYIKLDQQPELQITPAFNQHVFATEGNCRFHIRLGYMMAAGVQLLWRIRKTEDGWKTWRRELLGPPVPRGG